MWQPFSLKWTFEFIGFSQHVGRAATSSLGYQRWYFQVHLNDAICLSFFLCVFNLDLKSSPESS